MLQSDICIAGGGIIGLMLALELQARKFSVTVVESGHPLREASTAAAGMLAADDPHNPPELLGLSLLSIALYPAFLDRLRTLGGIAVPFQTSRTLQALPAHSAATTLAPLHHPILTSSVDFNAVPCPGFKLINENSIDPRQLATSLLAAVSATPVRLLTETPVISTDASASTALVKTPQETIECANFIDCTGAWAGDPSYKVGPIKGQVLAVTLPPNFPLAIAVRTGDIYIVPRTTGPAAGRAIIGATVEDAGFDKEVHLAQIDALRLQAVALLPQLAAAKIAESWAGLRPATPDRLPLIGAHPLRPHHWVASGHYRNGILLAPATAHVMAQLLAGSAPSVSLQAFSPARPSCHNARAS